MYVKSVFILCVQAFFIQAISTQSIGATESHGYTATWGPTPSTTATLTWGASSSPIEWEYAPATSVAASNGPALIPSASLAIPNGVAIMSDTYEGLAAGIPSGTVAVEGTLSTAGFSGIAYGCGNSVGITTEDVNAYGFTGMAGVGYGDGVSIPVAYGSGIGYGPCGYGAII